MEDETSVARDVAALRAEIARLRENDRESQRLIRELGDAIAARDTFIAVAGHELRNPMSTILVAVSHLSSLMAQSKPPLAPARTSRMASLDRHARAFMRRATTLLDVSRFTSAQASFERALVDWSEIAASVVDELSTDFTRAGSTVDLQVAPKVLGWWDRTALEQIVYNLVSNAIKYGAGKPITVVLSAAGDGQTASLDVCDQGVGIAEADRARVFERFERAVTERVHGGFGLGLWIARQLVETLGGTIDVASTVGVGSRFTVVLPRAIEVEPK